MNRACILAFLGLSASAFSAGTFNLSREGEMYSLVAEGAVLSDILAELDRQEPAALRFYGTHDEVVSASYRAVSLDTLLYRLGVSYVLTYEADADGNYRLDDALMLDSDGMGVDAATAAMIRDHIRNLRNDDVYNNAHHAFYALMRLECKAVPFLEDALYDPDFQCRQAAAILLARYCSCPGHPFSDRLIEVLFEALDQDHNEYRLAEFIWLGQGYDTFQDTGVYARVRSRILNNVTTTNGRVRLYSSLLAARHGESAYIPQLVKIMAPHLADNDIPNDASACARALFQLGTSALPYLQPYRNSSDQQQAELIELICSALETGEYPRFIPIMYYGYSKFPALEDSWCNVTAWSNDRFPDEQGHYHNLNQPRQTAADVYGTNPQSDFVCLYPMKPIDENISEPKGLYDDTDSGKPVIGLDNEPFLYTVKESDTRQEFETLHYICIKFSARRADVMKLNPHIPADGTLVPGVKLLIPWE